MSKITKVTCRWCLKQVAMRNDTSLYKHVDSHGKKCAGSGAGLLDQTIKYWTISHALTCVRELRRPVEAK